MKVSKAVAGLFGLAGVGVAVGAPGEDPIKDGQNFVAPQVRMASGEDPIKGGQGVMANAASMGEDPIKDGQNIMAAKGTDLGSNAPSRPNYGLSFAWGAYVYSTDGVRYIQINDQAGVVQAVVGFVAGRAFVLPIGIASDRVTFSSPTNGSTLIYRDAHVEISTCEGTWFVRSI